jgi:hypothetical protein
MMVQLAQSGVMNIGGRERGVTETRQRIVALFPTEPAASNSINLDQSRD